MIATLPSISAQIRLTPKEIHAGQFDSVSDNTDPISFNAARIFLGTTAPNTWRDGRFRCQNKMPALHSEHGHAHSSYALNGIFPNATGMSNINACNNTIRIVRLSGWVSKLLVVRNAIILYRSNGIF